MQSKLAWAARAALLTAALGAFAGLTGAAQAESQCGKASWYRLGGKTASGERSVVGSLTAAHRSLPFGTRVRVENLKNGKFVVVRINDRGPFGRGRVIDVSRAAAEQLDMVRAGTASVRITVVEGDAAGLKGCRA